METNNSNPVIRKLKISIILYNSTKYGGYLNYSYLGNLFYKKDYRNEYSFIYNNIYNGKCVWQFSYTCNL